MIDKWDILGKFHNLETPTIGGKYIWADLYLVNGWRIQKNILSKHYRLLDDHNKRRAWGTYPHCLEKLNHYKATLDLKFTNSHIVLLFHGLGRHSNTLKKLTNFICESGFSAYSLNYPSTFLTVEDHTDNLDHLLNNLDGVTSLSFIGHSLGGLIARSLLSRTEGWRKKITAKHLIMLGTPNNGARIAEMMSNLKLFHTVAGPSGQYLRPININGLPRPNIPTLVIAGGRGTKIGYNPLFGEDNDGIVTVNETKIEGMTDFKRVNAIHTTIMDHPDSMNAIIAFIRQK